VSETGATPQASMFEAEERDPELRAARMGSGSVAAARAAGGSDSSDPLPESPRRSERGRTPEPITFEQGYEELKAIVARLDDPELPIHEMFEGFRRGKGLEQALRAYLREREGELAELEAGNDLVEFEIVAPSR
jgi:exodeoxyribonuclease VII small subunit